MKYSCSWAATLANLSTSLSCWLALFVRQFCEPMVVQQALVLATVKLWLGWPRGVRNLQAMA